ncbi:MAG TPA: PIN domain-containing protein [Thermomicrobiales bacterium]|nr:PIN domain-containing protein [Thermomicrobiales bacterium]
MSASGGVAALLDASVLVPAALRDTLLRVAGAGLYRVAFSELILDEVRRALVANSLASVTSADRLIENIHAYFWFALVAGDEPPDLELSTDPGDRHVLAAAIEAKVDIIVTANLRHVPNSELGPYGMTSMSPDQFLLMLAQRDANALLQIVTQQAAALKSPPLSPADVLGRLRLHAPAFVEHLASLSDALRDDG